MPAFDGKVKLFGANTKVDSDGVLHVIVVRVHIRDDESKAYEPTCFCGELIPLAYNTVEEAEEAGETHKQQVTPAPTQSTYTSIIRRALGIRR